MAYSPFYVTPEELAVYQEAQEQEILAGDNVRTWHKYDVEEPFRYYFKLFAFPFVIAPFLLTLFIHTSDTVDVTIFSFILSVMVSGAFYLTIGLDYRYDYIFSDKGFVMKKRRNMPKWVNTATQAVGWIGAVVCVVMVAMVGPMALAGAGAFILVSFKMLKRQPDEPTEVRIGEREDWLFADYNKKRKVIQFYFKHDICRYRDTAHKTIFRSQDRSDCYVFFKTEADLESMVKQLSEVYKLDCKEVDDHKKLFEAKPESRLFSIPVCSREYQTEEVFDLRASNAPLPEREYLYNGKWQTESEIEQSKSELTAAKV
ncbi:hypothetical protein K08M3_20290 [Vibrio alginolyticus]|uniref:Uncharacterized protein n=1 Tax=Vibrio alginolyticus TaxID=663 RepID=A0A1W6W9Q7_VIBAL|nr:MULTISPECIES: hypothetical protein [Vibrio]NAW94362.1 hypothetical protein [Vibrio sp. V42_P2S4T144]ARO98961.1 hypothetical protein K01M1_20240 [Vibrio alginolyticus]ARP03676.1 hypothetical protein K04M1_20380 [Vibrio alginolyticus]ARP08736.1 hypothetical protein K04M3_20410 [Vibrio alginolyticus]ARP13811.1 hypothetical protein K04M5_20290 [Vibrio alginolyticus]